MPRILNHLADIQGIFRTFRQPIYVIEILFELNLIKNAEFFHKRMEAFTGFIFWNYGGIIPHFTIALTRANIRYDRES